MDEYPNCTSCRRIIDSFRESIKDGKCSVCQPSKVSDPPFNEHMMRTMEPYIKWRESEAVKAALHDVALTYLKTTQERS